MNEPRKILIADDELPARVRLRHIIGECDEWSVCGEATTGREVLALCHAEKPDVVLLDIRMPDMDGVEAAYYLAEMNESPAIIFTTAYDEYAIKAFDAQAVGYLLKPVRREKLQRALKHAVSLSTQQLDSLTGTGRENLCARRGNELRLIPVDGIHYMQADNKYVRVCHADGEDLIEDSLKTLETEYSDKFIRIHRNTLASRRCIERLDQGSAGEHRIWLRQCANPLAVSRRHAPGLKKFLQNRP
jgi:two-component system response regulator AlgR